MIQFLAFIRMEEFQLYQLLISDLRYQNDRKVLAYRKTNCSFIRHSWSHLPLKWEFRNYLNLPYYVRRYLLYLHVYVLVCNEVSAHSNNQ